MAITPIAIKPRNHSDRLMAKLRSVRVAQGVSQAQAAERAGYHRRTIENWEYGHMSPSLQNVIDYAQTLGYELILCALSKPTK